MKNIFLYSAIGMVLAISGISCSGESKADQLAQLAETADKMIGDTYNHTVTVDDDAEGIDVTINVADPCVDVDDMGKELFEALASINLKTYNPAELTALAQGLHKAKGNVSVKLVGADNEDEEFTLSPSQLTKLQSAKLTQLSPSILKTQIVKMAEDFCPNPAAHPTASDVEVSISKGFLEYNVVWPAAKAYSTHEQGWLTNIYFNPLKRLYTQVNDGCPGLINLLEELGIDGVRMVYSSPDSDKELRQAFPWRELAKPIEETPAKI